MEGGYKPFYYFSLFYHIFCIKSIKQAEINSDKKNRFGNNRGQTFCVRPFFI